MEQYTIFANSKRMRFIPPVSAGEGILELTSEGIKIFEDASQVTETPRVGIGLIGVGMKPTISYDEIKQFDIYSEYFSVTFYGEMDIYGNIFKEEVERKFYFDRGDDRAISGWLDYKNLMMMWSRQTGVKFVIAPLNSPVFEKRVPPVYIHCRIPQGTKFIPPDYATKEGDGTSLPQISPAFLYHEEAMNMIAKQMEQKEINYGIEHTSNLRKVGGFDFSKRAR